MPAYSLFTRTDPEELLGRIDRAHRRFADLQHAVDASTPLPGSEWTARDVTAHVITVIRRYTRRDTTSTDGLADTPREVDLLNADQLRELAHHTPEELLAELDHEIGELRSQYEAASVDLRERFAFHGGITVDLAAALSNLIGEFTLHGRDIAVAAQHPWDIDPRDATLILNGVLQIVPAYVRHDATGSLTMELRLADSLPWHLDLTAGAARSEPATGRPVDAILRGPAPTMVLAVYSRLTPIAAARRGLRVVGGRRPWKVLGLPQLLEQP